MDPSSILAIIIYPVGMLIFTATLLAGARSAIRLKLETPLSRATRFLWDEYEASFYCARTPPILTPSCCFGLLPRPFPVRTVQPTDPPGGSVG